MNPPQEPELATSKSVYFYAFYSSQFLWMLLFTNDDLPYKITCDSAVLWAQRTASQGPKLIKWGKGIDSHERVM